MASDVLDTLTRPEPDDIDLEMRSMRLVWLSLFLLMCTSVVAQTNISDLDNSGGLGLPSQNTGGGSGGSSGVPQGAEGAGGTNENLATAFGERTTVNETPGFLGANANAQQGNFVGQNQTIANGANGGQFGNRGGFQGGGFQGGGRGGQFGQQTQRQAPRRIKTRLVLPKDFAPAFRIVPADTLQSNLSRQYSKIDEAQAKSKVSLGSSRVFQNAEIQVSASGRIVTLRGQVRSDRERKLAERIAKFEPGVDRVENLLTVAAIATP